MRTKNYFSRRSCIADSFKIFYTNSSLDLRILSLVYFNRGYRNCNINAVSQKEIVPINLERERNLLQSKKFVLYSVY